MHCIVIISVKGGVGKTSCSVGLARALKRRGLRVGILDLDYRSPEVPMFLGVKAETALERAEGDALIPPMVEGMAVFSMAYVWPESQAVMVEDGDAVQDVRQLLTPGIIAWPELDYLVCDSPPNSSGITKELLSAPGVGAVAVSHPSTASEAALLRTLDLLAELRVPLHALVSNQGSGEDGVQRYDLTDEDLRALAEKRGIPVFQAVPHIRGPGKLDSYFDTLAAKIVDVKPVLLKKTTLEGSKWTQLTKLLKQMP